MNKFAARHTRIPIDLLKPHHLAEAEANRAQGGGHFHGHRAGSPPYDSDGSWTGVSGLPGFPGDHQPDTAHMLHKSESASQLRLPALRKNAAVYGHGHAPAPAHLWTVLEEGDASVCSPLPDEVSALDEGSIHDRGASPEKLRDIDGEAEDDVSELGSPRVILDDDVSELTEARA